MPISSASEHMATSSPAPERWGQTQISRLKLGLFLARKSPRLHPGQIPGGKVHGSLVKPRAGASVRVPARLCARVSGLGRPARVCIQFSEAVSMLGPVAPGPLCHHSCPYPCTGGSLQP